ncbi:MAG TPA: YigZ family protein [Cyclobacteriaceae bacterium]|nr:YigZ family protein [Cyclobacteriaceae bacterium]HRX01231.1 YigZ family protein [Cyclobacteriaceae bacterium]
MDKFSYLTVSGSSKGLYKEKGSRFLSFVFYTTTVEQAKNKLDSLRKEFFDARHHCFAWVIGERYENYRSSDDGEPNHSAGDPILGQIRSRNLTNVLVVVIRYFGGTKLGVGGLISAYRVAAQLALDAVTIVEKEIVSPISIEYDYSATPEVMRLIKEFELEVHTQKFENRCLLEASVKLRSKELLLEKLKLLVDTGNPITFSPSI